MIIFEMSVVIDFPSNFVPCPTHGWNKRLKQMAASAGVQMVEILTSGQEQDFICTKCRSESEGCKCSHANPHTLLNILYKVVRKEKGCECEHICRCNTVEVV
jgi:hypothetical protein